LIQSGTLLSFLLLPSRTTSRLTFLLSDVPQLRISARYTCVVREYATFGGSAAMLWLLDVALRRLMSMSGSRERRLRFCLQCHIADVRKDPINLRDYSPERSAAFTMSHAP